MMNKQTNNQSTNGGLNIKDITLILLKSLAFKIR